MKRGCFTIKNPLFREDARQIQSCTTNPETAPALRYVRSVVNRQHRSSELSRRCSRTNIEMPIPRENAESGGCEARCDHAAKSRRRLARRRCRFIRVAEVKGSSGRTFVPRPKTLPLHSGEAKRVTLPVRPRARPRPLIRANGGPVAPRHW